MRVLMGLKKQFITGAFWGFDDEGRQCAKNFSKIFATSHQECIKNCHTVEDENEIDGRDEKDTHNGAGGISHLKLAIQSTFLNNYLILSKKFNFKRNFFN